MTHQDTPVVACCGSCLLCAQAEQVEGGWYGEPVRGPNYSLRRPSSLCTSEMSAEFTACHTLCLSMECQCQSRA